mgnify:CR=1 FL=1
MPKIEPFTDESHVIQINGLTIENHIDRVSVFGSIDFTNDKIGLDKILQVKQIIDAIAVQLESASKKSTLTDAIQIEKPVPVDNPF